MGNCGFFPWTHYRKARPYHPPDGATAIHGLTAQGTLSMDPTLVDNTQPFHSHNFMQDENYSRGASISHNDASASASCPHHSHLDSDGVAGHCDRADGTGDGGDSFTGCADFTAN
ncbi:hypothetical protein V1264_011329 [Littorina saxatilis]|uniref:Uncharacterized protein n=1 Tax=Littorina saxatilis TaxID=31220 RepID=A0AAN9BUV0_9CAEN